MPKTFGIIGYLLYHFILFVEECYLLLVEFGEFGCISGGLGTSVECFYNGFRITLEDTLGISDVVNLDAKLVECTLVVLNPLYFLVFRTQ